MTIQIITSSYPAHPNDGTGTAGLFVRDFALGLAGQGHTVIVLVAARKDAYVADPGITIVPLAWRGGDQELASVKFLSPRMWPILLHFLWNGCRETKRTAQKFAVERTLCMWVMPAGIFGWYTKSTLGIPYDLWALGSDIWKIRKLPFGKRILKKVIGPADRVFADGIQLAEDVERISGREAIFLPSCRVLPRPNAAVPAQEFQGRTQFLFVGRYHRNKGSDVLLQAVAQLSPTVREKLHVDLYGDGPMKNDLQRLARNLGIEGEVNVHGVIGGQEYSTTLVRSHYLIIPSRIESIPLVLSDAAQMGLPVVATDVGDMGKLVKEHKAGIVVAPESPESLARGMEEACSVERQGFQQGVKELAAQFNLAGVIQTWLRITREKKEQCYEPS